MQKRREKRRGKGRRKGNRSKKEGKYSFFVSLLNIGPYDSQKKSPQKTGKN